MKILGYLKRAHREHFAIPQFNVSTLEAVKAAALAAQECKAPVIVGLSEGERKFMDSKVAVSIVNAWAGCASVSMFVNADHTRSLDLVKEALKAGFGAIHFDGSKLSYNDNVSQTRGAAEMVRKHGSDISSDISIEGELGYLRGGSALHGKVEIKPEDLTDPEQARAFAEATGIDILAVAVGNVHGLDTETGQRDQLDIERIKKISEATGLPLVLHGASDVSQDQMQKAIEAGICKVNINTALRIAYVNTLREILNSSDEITIYKILDPVVEELRKIMVEKIMLFGANNKI